MPYDETWNGNKIMSSTQNDELANKTAMEINYKSVAWFYIWNVL